MNKFRIFLFMSLTTTIVHADQNDNKNLEIGNLDVKNFPYFYKYRNDIYGDLPNEKQKEVIINHAICQKFVEKYRNANGKYDLKKLKDIVWEANNLAYKRPLGVRNPVIEPDVQVQNDQVMAIVNCAQVLLLLAEAQQAQKNLNELLS